MSERPIVALIYDFDKTLCTKDMQEYAFIPSLGMDSVTFWKEVNDFASKNQMDPILAYMYMMTKMARGKVLLTKNVLREQGRNVELLPGIPEWFSKIREFGESEGVRIEHYIVSSGLTQIILGTGLADEFSGIYASEFLYDENGVPIWPGLALNYTSKTQFIFRINKGIRDITEAKALNSFTPQTERRIPYRNMIYIGDGLTDVPCMKLVKLNGGHSIGVYQGDDDSQVCDLIRHDRVNYITRADYRFDQELASIVKKLIVSIKKEEELGDIAKLHQSKAL
ncbi:haloacid dehalogenase-like hydrolase [bacterium]|nr:haloacid dehalogenase-like hydrolase [bacterium]